MAGLKFFMWPTVYTDNPTVLLIDLLLNKKSFIEIYSFIFLSDLFLHF